MSGNPNLMKGKGFSMSILWKFSDCGRWAFAGWLVRYRMAGARWIMAERRMCVHARRERCVSPEVAVTERLIWIGL